MCVYCSRTLHSIFDMRYLICHRVSVSAICIYKIYIQLYKNILKYFYMHGWMGLNVPPPENMCSILNFTMRLNSDILFVLVERFMGFSLVDWASFSTCSGNKCDVDAGEWTSFSPEPEFQWIFGVWFLNATRVFDLAKGINSFGAF